MNKNLFQTTLYPLVLTVFLILASSPARATDVSGTLSSDTTWTTGGSPYTVVASLSVADGATLTIQPGVEVIVNRYYGIYIDGTLDAEGTASNPITIRGSSATPSWWSSLQIRGTGSASLAFCTITDAGYSGDYSAVYKLGTGSLSLRNCTISGSSGAGLRLTSGYSSFLSQNNTFSNNHTGVRLGINTSFSDTSSVFSNNTIGPVSADGGTHTTDVVWQLSPAYSIVLTSTQTIAAAASLTIEPGTVIKFYQYEGLNVDGQLTAEGTAGSPIHFTSHRDDTVGGDSNNNGDANQPWADWWRSIQVRNDGSASFENCTIAWAGYTGDDAGILKSGTGGLSIRSCTFKHTGGAGLRLNSGYSSFLSENNNFESNTQGIRLGLDTSFTDTTSTFSNNSYAQVSADGGTHSMDVSWELSSEYSILLTYTHYVPEGETLTIQPGTIIKFVQYESLVIDGQLIAEGTAGSPIYFTSHRDDTVGGDSNNNSDATAPWPDWWSNIRVRNSGSATLENCTIAWAGYSGDDAGVMKTDSGSLSVRNCTFNNIGGAGLRLNSGYSSFLSENNHFDSNSQGIRLGLDTSFTDTTSTFSNNSYAQVTADGGAHTTDISWELSPEYAILLTYTHVIPEGATLTIQPDTVVKFVQYQSLIIDGQLIAEGTEDRPIHFTSYLDDTVGGDSNNNGNGNQPWAEWWSSIRVRNAGSASLKNCTIAWAGYGGDDAGIMKSDNGSLSIRNCTVKHIGGAGLYLNSGYSSFLSENNHFESNTQGIRLGLDTSFTDTTSTFSSNSYAQVTADGGAHSTDVSWELSPEYAILLTYTHTIPEGATLTIQPGTIIKIAQYQNMTVNGQLIADGTAENPIHFTSYLDDSVGGDSNNNGNSNAPFASWWSGLRVQNLGTANLAHCTIAYSGYGGENTGLQKSGSGDLDIRHCTFDKSSGSGLRIANNSGAVLSEFNHFNNSYSGVRLGINTSFSDTTSTFTNNSLGPVVADGGTHSLDVKWELLSAYSIVLTGSQTVATDTVLTLMPGVVIKFLQYNSLLIEGELIALGTEGSPIHFTSHRDDTVGGDSNNNGTGDAPYPNWWGSIRINGTGSASLANCTIAYPGYAGENAGIFKTGNSELNLLNCTFTKSGGSGLRFYQSDGVSQLVRCRFFENPVGVLVEGSTEAVVLQGCHYNDNTQYGVRNLDSTEVDARSNWWGDASGPYHPTLNPDGTGNTVSDGVLFDPWRTNESMITILSPIRSGTIVAGDTLRFAGSPLQDPSAGYKWEFGDGRSSIVRSPGFITFSGTGSFEVTYAAVVDGVLDPLPETRNFDVVPNTGNRPDLSVQSLTVPSSIGIGQASTIQYVVVNSGPGSIASMSWTDRVYLSEDTFLDTGDHQVASTTVMRSLAPGESYQGSIPMTLPPVAEGARHLILSLDDHWQVIDLHRLNNEKSAQITVLVPQLQDGLLQQADYLAGKVEHYFKFTTNAGQNLKLDFLNSNPGLEAYVSFGKLPTRSLYDYKVMGGSLVVPSPGPGEWFVLVYGAAMPQAGSYKLQFDMDDLIISSATPVQQDSATELELTVSGAGFSAGVSVNLIATNGTPYSAGSVSINSYTSLTANFPAGMLLPGIYDIRLSHAGDTATLPGAITMIAGGQPDLYVDIISPQRMGYHQLATLYVEYGNRGNAPMPAPLLIVTALQNGSPGALFTLDQSLLSQGFWTSAIPKGFASSVRLLGGGAEPGILQPGEHMRVPVYYAGWLKPWDFSYPPFEFDVRAFTTSDSHPMDWAYLKGALKPPDVTDEAWNGIWQNFTANIGNTSGDFVRTLSASATYLYRIGVEVRDVYDLLAFEILKAKGMIASMSELAGEMDLNPHEGPVGLFLSRTFPRSIPNRFRLGPLGYGWNHSWEISLEKEADGTVSITSGSGAVRVFQPDSRNSGYFSSKGDTAKLTQAGNGGFVMTHPNGNRYSFNSSGQLHRIEDRNGNALAFAYAGGRLDRITHSNGLYIDLDYNGSGLISQAADALGNQVTYQYDAGKHLVSVTNSKGRPITYAYETGSDFRKRHALREIHLPGNVIHTFSYDSAGRLASQSDGLASISYAYRQGEVTVTDGEGFSNTLSFNHRGLISRVLDAEGGVTLVSLDASLHNTRIQAPDGTSMQFHYDRKGRLQQVTNQKGTSWSYEVGPYDNIHRSTSPSGQRLQVEYDSSGNATRMVYPNGHDETFQHNASGRLTQHSDALGVTETIAWNSVGLPVSQTYSDGSSRTYQYNSKNLLVSATNSAGTSTFDYNAKGELTKASYPNGLYVEYEYDEAGRLSSATDQNGLASRYSYNAAGKLQWLRNAADQTLVQYLYNNAGRLSEKRFSSGARTQYTYNGRGQVTQQATYDPTGILLASYSVTYDSTGLPLTYQTPQGSFTWGHDPSGLVEKMTFIPIAGSAEVTRYYRNADGSLNRMTVNGTERTFTANAFGNYTGAGDVSASFNAIGNITSRTTPDGSFAYRYDAAGNLVEMDAPEGTYEMVYDALGTPLRLTTPDQQLNYLYDRSGLPRLLGEYEGNGDPIRTFQFGINMDVVHFEGSSFFPEYDPLRGETVLAMPAVISAFKTMDAGSPYAYLPWGYPYRYPNPYVPGPYFHGHVIDGYMSMAAAAIKAGGKAAGWAYEGYDDSPLTQFARNEYIGYAVGGTSLPGSLSLANNGLAELFKLRVVITDTPKFVRNFGDFVANNGTLGKSLGALSLLASGVEVVDGISDTWSKNKSVDLVDVACFWNGSLDSGESKIRHGLATAALTGAGLLLGTTAATITFPVAAVVVGTAAVLAFASDFTKGPRGLQEKFWIWWDELDVTGETIRGSRMSGSGDPNQKLGVNGYGEENYVPASTTLTYRIDFENRPEATAPAQVVIIRDQLPEEVDWESFQILELGFGDISIPVEPGKRYFETVIDYAYQDSEYTFDIEVHVEVSIEDGEIFAIFYAIDPETELPPTVDIGFLPPEPEKVPGSVQPGEGRGQGHITYSVSPREDLPSGTAIRNIATIQFDFSLDIDTNQIDPMDPSKGTDPDKEALVTIDSDVPQASIEALPELSPSRFLVSWGGESASGMRSYDVYFRANAGAWLPWLIGTAQTSAIFIGDPYSVYDFYAVGINNVGTEAPYSPVIQSFTTAGVDDVDIMIERTPDKKVKLSWSGYSGFGYQIQTSTDQSSWINVGPVHQAQADGEGLSFTDNAYDFSFNKFYRIIVSLQ